MVCATLMPHILHVTKMSSEGGEVPAGGGAARIGRLGLFPLLLVEDGVAADDDDEAEAVSLGACKGSDAFNDDDDERLEEEGAREAPPPRADA